MVTFALPRRRPRRDHPGCRLRPRPGRRRAGPRRAPGAARPRRAGCGPGRRVRDQGHRHRLEAEELVQVTAEVEGAVSDVTFNEGDRVSPADACSRASTPTATGWRRSAPRPPTSKALADERRAESDLAAPRGSWPREQLVADRGAEPLARRERAPGRASPPPPRPRCDIAQQNVRALRRAAPAAPASSTRADGRDRPVREAGRRCWRRSSTSAGCACASRSRRASRCARARASRSCVPRGVARRRASSPRRIYHVGDVADPATRQVEVLAWVKNPGVLKPGFFAEVDARLRDPQGRRWWCPRARSRPASKGFVTYVVEDGKARAAPGRASACAPGTASWRSSPA